MASSIPKLPPPRNGKLTTILSIDGGGVRGIIPSILLAKLEDQIQALDGSQARLADYFDVISGTNTGGLVAAMLTAPNENGRPIFAATDIKQFYLKNCPQIFSHESWVNRTTRILSGPIYDEKALRDLIHKTVKTRLSHSLTNLVIPTFDIKTLKPVIFASNEVQVKQRPDLDCTLEDICNGTTATPTILPAYQFVNKFEDSHTTAKTREFNLIDGGVLANNPTLLAMGVIKKAILNEDPYFMGIEPMDYGRFLVISLGTGSAKKEHQYDAKMASKWGVVEWHIHKSSNPLIEEVFMQCSIDLVELHLASLFQEFEIGYKYLRIQYDALENEEASLDISSTINMNNLVNIGENLLGKTYMILNVETDDFEPDPTGITNENVLQRLAEQLVDERKLRINKGH